MDRTARKLYRLLFRPICWIFGHPREVSGYRYTRRSSGFPIYRCSRCHRPLKAAVKDIIS